MTPLLEGNIKVREAEEHKVKRPYLLLVKTVNAVNFKNVDDFVKHHLLAGQNVRTDAFRELNIFDKTQQHEPRAVISSCLRI